ncbi:hypothetical protein PGT21_030589 [Puccinia graminis f. sp. tritici]|uniref:Phytocyanin domain-containing protein n=1 Tax=Puccinia graminis f. sp. tritici TaxID=56615 RepID=A0A5B0QXL6_PUCGR|nr:hypothetical protein PGT21_030589 [Puccinia graminis f. sp. tritici]
MKLAPRTCLLGTVCLIAGVRTADSGGTDHKVTVGKGGSSFEPSHVSAKKGDTITFTFFQDGHTLTQTHFNNPCAGLNPPSDSFCTVTSATKTESPSPTGESNYPTGGSDYPTGGAQPPKDSQPPSGGSQTPPQTPPTTGDQQPPDGGVQTPSSGTDYPTFGDPSKNPSPNTTTPSPPTDPTPPTKPVAPTPEPPTSKDPSSNPGNSPTPPPSSPPTCLCPAPPTQSSDYPTGPEPTSPKQKTCDAKCIEVSGECQTSTDCDAQSKSPSDSKCKIEDGKCKKCGQSSLFKKKRSLDHYSLAYLRKRLLRRDGPPPIGDGVQKVDIGSAESQQAESTTQLNTAPTSQAGTAPVGQDTSASAGQGGDVSASPDGASSSGQDTTASAPPNNGVDANSSPSSPGQDSKSTDPKSSGTLGADKTEGSAPTDKTEGSPPTGLDSGFIKVSEEQKSTGKSWKIQITDDSKPLWFMCATLHHCTSGMVFAVNPSDSGDKTFDKFVQAAKASTCPTQYPTKTNLQGDGCNAPKPPCSSTKKESPPTDTGSGTPPVSSGGNPEQPKSPENPEQPNTNTPTVSSGEGKDPSPTNPPAQSPPPPTTAEPPQGNTTTPEGKTSGQADRFDGTLTSFILYIAIISISFFVSGGSL